ncbi:MAG: amino acid transporter [Sulfobacillus benefaciens]|uniref:Amino acid transporter n=1 Tax=Sulfobacillus benefaciens TaxID=453960 RepID=A0A2T2WXG3_9FIRM|nr:MAG: amino acid transporter [Sulfobacillus benefaciens]
MNGLRRGLTTRDQVMIGIVGSVGTGVLFSTAGMAAAAGPGVVIGWLLGGLMYGFVMMTYIELAQLYPEAGGPTRYSIYSHGRITNLINSMSDFIWYLFIPPIEALAVVEGINYFWPKLIASSGAPTILGGVLGAIFLLLFVPFNYYGIKAFSWTTNALGTVKLVLYVAAAVGFIVVAHFGNFIHYGGIAPFGFNGIFLAIPLGMFAYGGIRVVADYSEELSDPSSVRRAFIWILLGQTAIYVLFAIGFVVSLNWSAIKLHPGAWASISLIPGNPFLAIAGDSHLGWVIPVTIVIAIIGPFVTGYIYQGAGSRVLLAISRSGFVSAKLREISEEYAIPLWALAALAIIGAILAFVSAPFPTIYSLISDAVVAGYLGLATNPVVMFALRKNGRKPKSAIWGGSTFAVLAFASVSLIVYWSGWPSVPYAVALITLGSLIFGIIYKVKNHFRNAIWYMAYIVFLTLMTYIGGVGAKSVVNIDLGSLIVVVVSVLVFLPWGVAARMGQSEMDRAHQDNGIIIGQSQASQ